MKVALVHDYLNQYGGAERVLQVLCAMFPQAPIYATMYSEAATGGVFRGRVIRTSFLQNVPLARRFHHQFSPLMPLAVEGFDVSEFDVVLSVAASFAKGIITKPHTRHICYCLTPPRFLWDDSQKFINEFRFPSVLKALSLPVLSYLRVWDRQAAERVDQFIAISGFVAERIDKYYGRNAPVICPPVNVSNFYMAERSENYFLMVGRLVAYKRFDLAIRACNRLKLNLKIVGTGVESERLKKIAGPTIEFLGLADDKRLADLYAHARGLIFPQEEDFGIVPLEAMAAGRPVIAYRAGGALETVIDGVTGIFFDEQNEQSLVAALERLPRMSFDPDICRHRAQEFDVAVFQEKITQQLTTNP